MIRCNCHAEWIDPESAHKPEKHGCRYHYCEKLHTCSFHWCSECASAKRGIILLELYLKGAADGPLPD